MAPYEVLDWLADDSPVIKIDFLLPTGIIVPLQVDRDSSISEIKGLLWEEAQQYPLYKDLGDKNQYIFQCVTRTASKVELLDESRFLDDYRPFGKFLKVVKKPSDKEEKIVNAHITYLIGKGIHEFDSMSQPEVSDFRRKMREECEAIAKSRDAKSWKERMLYKYPSELSDEDNFPKLIMDKLPADKLLQIYVCIGTEKQKVSYKFHVPCSTKPDEIVTLALQKSRGCNHSLNPDEYVLKVGGREEYLVSDRPLRHHMMLRKKGWIKKAKVSEQSVDLQRYRTGDVVLHMYRRKWWPARVEGRDPDGSIEVSFCGFDFAPEKVYDPRKLKPFPVAVGIDEVCKNPGKGYIRAWAEAAKRLCGRDQSHLTHFVGEIVGGPLKDSDDSSDINQACRQIKKAAENIPAPISDMGPPVVPPKGPHVKGSSIYKPKKPPAVRKSAPGKCLWDINDTFRFTVDAVSNYHFNQRCKYQLRCCIFHGPEPMCSVINSRQQEANQGLISFNETMEFKDLELVNIPRMARLCFMFSAAIDRRNKGKVHAAGGVKKIRAGGQEIIPLGWVNIPVFDYKANLRSGKCTLYMWDITEDNMLSEEELLNPIGTVESNPLVKSSMCLTLTFHTYDVCGSIYFPPFDRVIKPVAEKEALVFITNHLSMCYGTQLHEVLEVAAEHTHFQKPTGDLNISDMSSVMGKHFSNIMLDGDKQGHKEQFEALESILEQDALTEMDIQDKEKVWVLRYECWYHYQSYLSKLLASVNWANHLDVAQMQALLQCWKPLKPVEALELLDFAYADKKVREFAVTCLKDISDRELQMYLLQLVQVLKYESYLDCELVMFLLRRALNNQHIGHNLFWLLRSEVGVVPSVAVRFGLILEAYCRGTMKHMKPLVKEVEALDMFYRLADTAKKSNHKGEKAHEEVRKYLKEKNLEAFNEIVNPLDPGLKIEKLVDNKLKVMDSKMKPLWLEFDNFDKNGQPIKFMFKKGDDLRQDMLTLQILRIIDQVWKGVGMDLRLTAYGCLATGDKEGLIEIVTDAMTISNIQKKYSSALSAFNRQSLYKWLKENNPKEDMQRAMDEFMLSCAGYSVATYVLGVGDRHGDNIMLKKNGQLCHIDFGHIMGNFKAFFFKTITREPAPFQLTYDFVYLLRRGPENSEEKFNEFKKLCEDAYITLRKQRKLLITLFLMMVNTGIPELHSVNAISKHLNKTLVPSLTEEGARKHFQDRFKDSLNKATKVAVYGQVHNWAH